MSTPIRPSSSDEAVRENAASSAAALERPEKKNVGRIQLEILRTCEARGSFENHPKVAAQTYINTIKMLIMSNEMDAAVELFYESFEKEIWVHDSEAQEYLNKMRADLYVFLICSLLEKGFHVKAEELHSKAKGEGVWRDFPDAFDKTREALMTAGLIKDHEI